MKKILSPAFILFWIFVVVTYVYLQIIEKPSTTDSQNIGASIYFGLANAVILYFFGKSLMKEFWK